MSRVKANRGSDPERARVWHKARLKELSAKFIMQFSPCYIGIQQGSPELLRWLDTFIHLGMLNGSLSALSEKYVGAPLPPDFPSI